MLISSTVPADDPIPLKAGHLVGYAMIAVEGRAVMVTSDPFTGRTVEIDQGTADRVAAGIDDLQRVTVPERSVPAPATSVDPAAVLARLAGSTGLTAAEIGKSLSVVAGGVDRALRFLERRGRVHRISTQRTRGAPNLWRAV